MRLGRELAPGEIAALFGLPGDADLGEMSGSKVKQCLGNCMHISDIGNTWKQLLIRRESHPALSISEAR